MSGDINAINSWARSLNKRALAIAQNAGQSAVDVKARLIREDVLAKRRTHEKQRTGV